MVPKPRRKRGSGSLEDMKRALNVCVNYNLDVIEDNARDQELRQKACNCVVQATLAYARIVELYDVEREIRDLEQLTDSNGHR
jgi:hypothetical protein